VKGRGAVGTTRTSISSKSDWIWRRSFKSRCCAENASVAEKPAAALRTLRMTSSRSP
jgi:hypothetical protein